MGSKYCRQEEQALSQNLAEGMKDFHDGNRAAAEIKKLCVPVTTISLPDNRGSASNGSS